ncbi:resolvase domain protein [Desulfocucumis palustris]|uniref:Resolvase domain protein n=1 Tax=Desulfocucumis palustris TaxID=1898651 RepID=A0A2L2XG75_9FIRM|nr:recombinase family protein [Desulfocucumis palustris]GBF32891.1 resolvase domain protein [Desulfocucumis palustris]
MEQTRAVAYARVSSKEQAEKELSIPAQLKAIRKYCQDKNYKLVAEYLDEGKSAKTADRPAFQKMIALAKKQNRHFDVIIVHKFDRFSRSREDHVVYKALLKKVGVHVYSVTEQTDSETPHGFLLEGMLEVISEFYNMNLASETRKGMVENAKRGYHNGGSPPYGYRVGKIQDSRGNLKSVWVLGPEEEVSTVRRIFDLYVRQNRGYKSIVNILNSENTPSPTGKTWSFSTIWTILHNDVYIGRRTWNKHDYVNFGKKKKPQKEWIVVADAHPPIIDRDTFNAVAAKGQERSPLGGAYQPTGPSLYILRGMLKCPMCGVNMVTGANSRKNRGHTRYYHCGTYHRKGSKACKRNSVIKYKIEAAVLNCLTREFSLLSFPGSIEDEIRRYMDYQNREITFQLARIDDDIKHLNRRIEIARKEKTSYGTKYVAQYIKEMEGEIEKLTRERSEVDELKTSSNLTDEQLQYIRDRLKDFAQRIKIEPTDIQHSLLKLYINSIVYDQFSDNYKMAYHIGIPKESSAGSLIVLEKTMYFTLD